MADYLLQHVDVATVRIKPEVLALWESIFHSAHIGAVGCDLCAKPKGLAVRGSIFHSAHIGASGCIFCAKPVTLGKQGGIFRIARF